MVKHTLKWLEINTIEEGHFAPASDAAINTSKIGLEAKFFNDYVAVGQEMFSCDTSLHGPHTSFRLPFYGSRNNGA